MKDSLALAAQQPSATSALAVTSNIFTQQINRPVNSFPRLIVLDKMAARIRASGELPNLENTIFIGVQHLLKTTGSLFEILISLGAKPSNMYFAGKCYSTSPLVADSLRALGMNIINGSKSERWGEYKAVHNQDVKQLWALCEADITRRNKTIDGIIIVDDGAAAIENIPSFFTNGKFKIVGIEQTRGGIYSKIEQTPEYPVIYLGQSAAKQKLEPTFIQNALLNKLESTVRSINKFNTRIGIAGLGAIGKALMNRLLCDGYTLLVYDDNPEIMRDLPQIKNLKQANNLNYLLLYSDYIFGCTGRDITAGIDLLKLNGRDRTLISVSSEDKEFYSLIKSIAKELSQIDLKIEIDTMLDIKTTTLMKNKICIKNGGFPANFDSSGSSVPDNEIAITRLLILGAIYQAIRKIKTNDLTPEEVMLDPAMQRYAALLWYPTLDPIKTAGLPLQEFHNLPWIIQESKGKQPRVTLDNLFFIPERSSLSGLKASL